jgi:mannose-6-phosphate isomerase
MMRAKNMNIECLTFHPFYFERIWGGRKLKAYFNRSLPDDVSIGESWEMVDREDVQSIVSSPKFQGASLHEIWTNYREEIFGAGYDSARFPVLIKILDASDVLSVQVHPPLHQIRDHLEEPKDEFWYFVAAEQGAGIYAGLKYGTRKSDFEAALTTGNVADHLHRIATKPGGFICVPSGRLHAIDAGNLIFEIQQNSDTTYRVFDWNRPGLDGRPRQLHIEDSLRCIDFDDFAPALSESDREALVAWQAFRVDRWRIDRPRQANAKARFSIFQVATGAVSFGNRIFRLADLFLVPAASHMGLVTPCGQTAVVLRTTL